ncbi:MAG: WXG100 family type VII secretion target [Anaerolineaceae bacterium]|nr:WXG100 family type VII secretion target [Anaerolineaceae bacterium]
MADKIEINYELMTTIKTKFSDKAEQVNQLKQSLQAQIDNLRQGGWIGQGANAFYGEMDQLLMPSLTRLQQALVMAEENTATIATEFQAAEDEAQTFVNFTAE